MLIGEHHRAEVLAELESGVRVSIAALQVALESADPAALRAAAHRVIARTTSTRGSTGAGLKKCRPITRPRVRQLDAIAATDKDDVLVARIAPRFV